ncbi:DUF4365 domain-containing protein [Edaphocola aurantiacus]|uniref:DUF4365 domain-containing protein n=1 Tax=Edaphocola aurantiacus TaxID=2601682 RepID=UPI001C9499C3|nr:DUF4365 domain-containing protein [Edaphocola aurantiacus]
MAFEDLPQIDRPSLNSDASAIELQILLNRNSGFILREDVPDLGCDFDVELIKNETQASNWRFALQLKSVESISFIRDGLYLSYSFKTSRLGYLLRRQPAYGLVVVYDVVSKKLYYDYADEIYNRLMLDRGSDDWKANDQVNILIPVDNVLTKQSAEALHKKFIARFEQGALMHLSQGAKYGLPTVNLESKSGFDFNNLDDVKKALKKWGMNLLSQFDLQIVYDLITKLPTSQILSDKEICLIALIVYAESGKYADSVFYTERIRKRYELTEFEKGSVDFIELKNQLRLGDIGPKEYIERTRKLLPDVVSANSLTLRVNILYFELCMVKGLEPMPLDMGEQIQQLFFDIDNANIDPLQKQYLKLWNAENLERWIGHFRSEGFAELSVRENMGKPLTLSERLQRAESFVKVHNMFYTFLNGIDSYAKANDNLILQAHVIKLMIRFELSFEIDQISHDSPRPNDVESKIPKLLTLTRSAFNTFLLNNLYNDAYQVLLFQIDLYYVGVNRYRIENKEMIDELLKIKIAMEREYEFNGELSIPSLLKSKTENNTEKTSNLAHLIGLNDGQLDTLAEIMMQSNKFPMAKKINITKQMKSYQLFYERCKDPSIEVQEVLVADQIAYSSPVIFILKNRITNLVSLPSNDLDGLLKSWGF